MNLYKSPSFQKSLKLKVLYGAINTKTDGGY